MLQNQIVPGTGSFYREQNRIRAKKFRDKLQTQGYRQTSIYIQEKYLKKIDGMSRHQFFDRILQDHFQMIDKMELVKEIKRLKKDGYTSIQISEKVQISDRQVRRLWK